MLHGWGGSPALVWVFTRRPLGFGFVLGAFIFILVFMAFSPASGDVRLAESNALEL